MEALPQTEKSLLPKHLEWCHIPDTNCGKIIQIFRYQTYLQIVSVDVVKKKKEWKKLGLVQAKHKSKKIKAKKMKATSDGHKDLTKKNKPKPKSKSQITE